MENVRLTTSQQAVLGSQLVNDLFTNLRPPIPEGATLESLWNELCMIHGKIKKPKRVTAIKILLEHPQLGGLSTALVGDIIKTVYRLHGLDCDTNDNSIRWYISRKTIDWDIIPREKRNQLSNLLADNA